MLKERLEELKFDISLHRDVNFSKLKYADYHVKFSLGMLNKMNINHNKL